MGETDGASVPPMPGRESPAPLGTKKEAGPDGTPRWSSAVAASPPCSSASALGSTQRSARSRRPSAEDTVVASRPLKPDNVCAIAPVPAAGLYAGRRPRVWLQPLEEKAAPGARPAARVSRSTPGKWQPPAAPALFQADCACAASVSDHGKDLCRPAAAKVATASSTANGPAARVADEKLATSTEAPKERNRKADAAL
jgi:hypothetical protein